MFQQKIAGAVILGSDFKALGVIRSLGERGIPCVVIDNIPRSAWFSRYVVKRFKWPIGIKLSGHNVQQSLGEFPIPISVFE